MITTCSFDKGGHRIYNSELNGARDEWTYQMLHVAPSKLRTGEKWGVRERVRHWIRLNPLKTSRTEERLVALLRIILLRTQDAFESSRETTRRTSTYLASKASAHIPAASGAEADVPV